MQKHSPHIYNANRSIEAYLRKTTGTRIRRRRTPEGSPWKKTTPFRPVMGGFGWALSSQTGRRFFVPEIKSRAQLRAVQRESRTDPRRYRARALNAVHRPSETGSGTQAVRVVHALTRINAPGHLSKMRGDRIGVEYGTSWGWIRDIQEGYSKSLDGRHGYVRTPRHHRRVVRMVVPARPMLALTDADETAVRERVRVGSLKLLRDTTRDAIRASTRRRRA